MKEKKGVTKPEKKRMGRNAKPKPQEGNLNGVSETIRYDNQYTVNYNNLGYYNGEKMVILGSPRT